VIEPQIKARGLIYEVRQTADPVMVWADAGKLRQVLLNLIANAIRFTPSGGRITTEISVREAIPGVVYLRRSTRPRHGPGRPARGWVRKNMQMDQRKLDAARAVLGTATETDTVDAALDAVAFRHELIAGSARCGWRVGFVTSMRPPTAGASGVRACAEIHDRHESVDRRVRQ